MINHVEVVTSKEKLEKNTGCAKVVFPVRVIFNDPATIVFWSDDSKTVVKCDENTDTYDPYIGFCVSVAERVFGGNSAVKRFLKNNTNYNDYLEGLRIAFEIEEERQMRMNFDEEAKA